MIQVVLYLTHVKPREVYDTTAPIHEMIYRSVFEDFAVSGEGALAYEVRGNSTESNSRNDSNSDTRLSACRKTAACGQSTCGCGVWSAQYEWG